MPSWLDRLLRRATPIEPAPPPAAAPPAPEEDSKLLEAAQKSARAVAKLGLKLDGLEAKLEGGFADLRGQLANAPRGGASAPRPPFELLFDAADLLDAAAQDSSPEAAAGLAGIRARVERFLAEAGLQRVGRVEGELDPRLFRVVGAAPLAQGTPRVRVVRAAVLEGGRLVREGEALLEPAATPELRQGEST